MTYKFGAIIGIIACFLWWHRDHVAGMAAIISFMVGYNSSAGITSERYRKMLRKINIAVGGDPDRFI